MVSMGGAGHFGRPPKSGTVDAALFRGLLAVVIILIAVVVVGRLMFPLPDISQRPAEAPFRSAPTRASPVALTAAQQHPDLSGVMPHPMVMTRWPAGWR